MSIPIESIECPCGHKVTWDSGLGTSFRKWFTEATKNREQEVQLTTDQLELRISECEDGDNYYIPGSMLSIFIGLLRCSKCRKTKFQVYLSEAWKERRRRRAEEADRPRLERIAREKADREEEEARKREEEETRLRERKAWEASPDGQAHFRRKAAQKELEKKRQLEAKEEYSRKLATGWTPFEDRFDDGNPFAKTDGQ